MEPLQSSRMTANIFLLEEDKGKWDLPGGGFDVNEIDYKGVAVREIKEETGIVTTREELKLCAILGQTLPLKNKDRI